MTAPPRSGELALFDPRGKPPTDAGKSGGGGGDGDGNGGGEDGMPSDPTGRFFSGMALPSPPFHRVSTVRPVPGLLIVFPGWLVHQVLPAAGGAQLDQLRVSISLNLKGEWQDTSHVNFDGVEL